MFMLRSTILLSFCLGVFTKKVEGSGIRTWRRWKTVIRNFHQKR